MKNIINVLIAVQLLLSIGLAIYMIIVLISDSKDNNLP